MRHRDAPELVDVALLLGLAHAHEEAEQGDGLGLVALGCAAGEVVEFGALAGGVKDGLAHLDLGFGDFGGNVHTLDKAVEQGGVDAIDGLANIGKVHGGPFHVLVIFLGRGLKNHWVGVGAGVGPPRRFLELGGVLEEGVPNREGGGCLGYGDGARDDAGIVAAVDRDLGVFHGVHVHGLLLTTDGGVASRPYAT